MRVLVTGGAGFIGSHFARRAAQAGDDVVVLDKLTYAGNLESLSDVASNPRYAFVQGDVADRDAVRAAFEQHQPDAVMHLAAESHVDRSIESAEPMNPAPPVTRTFNSNPSVEGRLSGDYSRKARPKASFTGVRR